MYGRAARGLGLSPGAKFPIFSSSQETNQNTQIKLFRVTGDGGVPGSSDQLRARLVSVWLSIQSPFAQACFHSHQDFTCICSRSRVFLVAGPQTPPRATWLPKGNKITPRRSHHLRGTSPKSAQSFGKHHAQHGPHRV